MEYTLAKVLALVLWAMTALSASDGPSLTIELQLGELGPRNEVTRPFAWIRITNSAVRPTSISGSFYSFGEYIFLHIEPIDAPGERVLYPGGEIDFFDVLEHRCLKPGQTEEIGIDLTSWQHVVSGELVGPDYSFDLRPGTYRVKAVYSTERLRLRGPRGCPPFRGMAESEWVMLEVDADL